MTQIGEFYQLFIVNLTNIVIFIRLNLSKYTEIMDWVHHRDKVLKCVNTVQSKGQYPPEDAKFKIEEN